MIIPCRRSHVVRKLESAMKKAKCPRLALTMLLANSWLCPLTESELLPEECAFALGKGNDDVLLSDKGVGGIPGFESTGVPVKVMFVLFFSSDALDRKCGRGTCPWAAGVFPDFVAQRGGRWLELEVGLVMTSGRLATDTLGRLSEPIPICKSTSPVPGCRWSEGEALVL